ncbi:thiopeptide-type bacteriocin biosynthesis protein [Olivibacter sp. CPCC 100613]|uniref:lantibiotic dehydratase n=1 Tax=Olivibacter sp. CPCC 100613 TaxID=3079931 RepID=UPI002FFC885B
MDLKLLPTVICRTPLFSYEDTLDDKWDELKEAIKIASKDLYEQIKDTKKEDYDTLPEKVRFSCWKYFNRARFRATPFGPFGSITMVPLDKVGSNVILETEPTLHRFTNWIHKDTLLTDPIALYKNAKLFQANTSVYPCGDQLRYISMLEDGTFEIASIDKQAIIEDVLHKCKTTITKEEVVEHLVHAYALDLAVVTDFLIQLITLQLLLTDLHPNIIGTDYFKRVGLHSKALEQDPYIIATRPLLKGSLNIQSFKVIPEAINFIKDYLPQPVHKPLEDFKRAFQLKFEYREVPLLEALDPEIGVGYNELESSPHMDELVELLKNNAPSKEHEQIPYTPFHQFLLNGILKGEDIQLEELVKHDLPKYNTQPPNTFSVIAQEIEGQILIQQAGGATANSLLGRFTLENPNLTQYGKELVQVEEAANPEIIFFDIAYHSEKSIDNVNRRENIYKYQLPLLSWSDCNFLRSNDLMVSVVDNQIVLRSKEHNKRIIPRLTSAYNYNRSDLSVYRFLCDLQLDILHVGFSFNLQSIFPNLDFYPRITYKNVIFAPRIWKVPKTSMKENNVAALEALKSWLKGASIPCYIVSKERDQFLTFDYENLEDLSYLLQLQKKGTMYVHEAFIPPSSFIKNKYRQPYLSEVIVNLYHSKVNYSNVKSTLLALDRNNTTIAFPGEEWVYFEIYTHPISVNALLTDKIYYYIKEMKPKIKQWFFVRYSDPSYHIRLRIQLKNTYFFREIVTNLSTVLASDLQTGLIRDLQIKPYHKEIERYGIETIHLLEKHFCKDSEYVLKLIRRSVDTKTSYLLIIKLLSDTVNGLDEKVKIQHIQTVADNLAKKYKVNSYTFKKINKLSKEIISHPDLTLSKFLENKYVPFFREMNSLLNKFNRQHKLQVLGDLIHMHVNRLFTSDQNIHELIIYQLFCNIMKFHQKNPKRPD